MRLTAVTLQITSAPLTLQRHQNLKYDQIKGELGESGTLETG